MRTNSTAILTAILLAILTLPISLTGLSVALPDIGRDLGADLAALQWAVNAYAATLASFMLAAGSLADLFGRRKVFATGMAIFAVGSVVSAVAGDVVLLDLARAFSGIGAAAAATSAGAMLAQSFDGAARARAFGLFGMAIGVGMAFGPTIAGVLIDAFGWRAVFAVPALVSLGVLALVPSLPESRNPEAKRVDWAGTVSFTLALLLLITGFVEGPALGWSSPVILGAFAGALVLLVVFVIVERRVAEPMFDLRLLTSPRFVALSLLAAAIVAVLAPLLVYLPAYFTSVAGLTPGVAGATLILLTAPSLVLPPFGGLLARWVPPIATVVGSVALMAVGVGWLTAIGSEASLVGPLLVTGIGIGFTTGTIDGVVMSTMRPSQAGAAAGMFNTSRLTGETIAIAVFGAVLASSTDGQLAGPGYTGGLHIVLWSMAGLAVVAVLVAGVLLAGGRGRAAAGELAVAA